jgi:uncharacterized protein (UPF0261 family)
MTIASRDKKCIVIICNLDTRGEDIVFVKDLIRGRGHEAILVDFSMEEPPLLAGDVTCEEVALRGGLPIETVRQYYRSNREAATNNQTAGVAAIVADLVKQGQVHGVIGIGGATSTLVSTSNRIYVGSLEMFVAMNAAVTRRWPPSSTASSRSRGRATPTLTSPAGPISARSSSPSRAP